MQKLTTCISDIISSFPKTVTSLQVIDPELPGSHFHKIIIGSCEDTPDALESFGFAIPDILEHIDDELINQKNFKEIMDESESDELGSIGHMVYLKDNCMITISISDISLLINIINV